MADALRSAGGTVGAGALLTHAAPRVASPFGTASHVEGECILAIDVRGPAPPPEAVAFLDGIQRYAVEGRFGLVPVVRGYAAAAVLEREGAKLGVARAHQEEFLVVARSRLTPDQEAALEDVDLPIVECDVAERSHPILDVQLAAKEVERRREVVEAELAAAHIEEAPGSWLVVDGSLGRIGADEDGARVVGLVKSHETQFLEGADLEVALTLPEGHRTSVFARSAGARGRVFSFYLRLWPWQEHDLLHGLVRIERPPSEAAVAEATEVSRWLLAERAPLSAPDGRWDRLIYPIRQVETFLRAQAGGWW